MIIRPYHHRKPAEVLPWDPIPNWAQLARADEVTIHHHGEEIASGRIDMLSMDGSVLWLIQDAGCGRALFLYSDGAKVFRRQASAKPRKPRRTQHAVTVLGAT